VHQLQLALRTWIVLAALLLALLPARPPVLAHADYDHSEPAEGAAVQQAPTQVRIWFTQELFRRQGANDIEVYGPDGTQVDRDDATIDDDDRKLMSISLASTLADGLYTVRWRALSAEDGHEKQGEFIFTIGVAEATNTTTPTAPAQAAPANTPASTTQPGVLPCLGASAPLALVLSGAWLRRRR
jgi:methionine-rich copper-binding protein CopC